MTVRVATIDDMPEVLAKGAAFCDAAGWHEFNETDAEAYIVGLMAGGRVFLTDGGVLGACLANVPWNRGILMAVEVFWWSTDGRGIDLVRAFEAWAGEVANEIVFSTISFDPRADRIMEARGYALREKSWIKGSG